MTPRSRRRLEQVRVCFDDPQPGSTEKASPEWWESELPSSPLTMSACVAAPLPTRDCYASPVSMQRVCWGCCAAQRQAPRKKSPCARPVETASECPRARSFDQPPWPSWPTPTRQFWAPPLREGAWRRRPLAANSWASCAGLFQSVPRLLRRPCRADSFVHPVRRWRSAFLSTWP